MITMLNAAPARCSAELSEAYNYTDLLCVNETEVRGKNSWYACDDNFNLVV